MKAVGLVVEYNPFHNGHRLHVEESKQKTGAEVVIAVMSGSFLQRGEPALVSKWARAEMALQSGVDLVIELPYRFATANAELFAQGAIHLLEELRCHSFCFGSESGELAPFLRTYHVLKEKKETYNAHIQSFLQQGHSYPTASSLAFQSITTAQQRLDLSQPNNILGKEYIQTALANGYHIQPVTIKRVTTGYHDPTLSREPIASATGIRKAIIEEKQPLQTMVNYMPLATLTLLEQYVADYQSFHHWEMYWSFLKYRILSASAHELAEIYEIEEGIEHRFIAHAKHATSFQQFMSLMKTKRYTWARLQRMCLHILTHTKKEEITKTPFPAYIRLLGMTEKGQQYVRSIKKELTLPFIAKLSSYHDPAIEADLRAANVFAQGLAEPYQTKLIKREFMAPIIRKA